MAIVEKFMAAESAAERGGAPEPEQDKGPTIQEILADNRQSALFGKYLQAEGLEEMGERVVSGTVGRDAIPELTRQRKDFLGIMENVRVISESITPQSIEEIAKGSPELSELKEVVKPDGIARALKNRLPELAITDRAQFEYLAAELKRQADVKRRLAETETRIKETIDRYKLTEDEAVALMRGGDVKAAVEAVRSRMGTVRKIFSSAKTLELQLQGGAWGAEGDMLRMDREEVKRNKHDIGFLLQASIMDNPDVHRAFMAEMQGKQTSPESPDMPFSEIKTAASAKIDKEMEDAWGEWKEDGDWENIDAGRRAQVVDEFASQQAARRVAKRKGGIWATFWEQVYGGSIAAQLREKEGL